MPVQYCSAKLPSYMSKWYPCEAEAAGVVVAIEQCRHWINESYLPTLIGPDSRPVVEAANLMKRGKHSSNPRLQSLLSSVNRSNIHFFHNSAKNGLHITPDHLSRLNVSCSSKDCAVERFLLDTPKMAECYAINTLEHAVLSIMSPGELAATTTELQELLEGRQGSIPLGNQATWKQIQQEDMEMERILKLKRTGDIPNKKDKRNIRKAFNSCEISTKGLLVKREFPVKIPCFP